ncbi:hypothetical protein V8D89_000126 [Ganoderma adspersum]
MPSRIISMLYGFTRSDVMGVLIPTTAFGTLASGSLDPSLLVLRGFWVWLHLLQFCVSNQSLETDEDCKNKPWRPIPAGNISLHAARRLRWLLLAACLAYSAHTGVLLAGAVLSFATWAHNEANLGSHWLTRNALNAIGYASFSIGASNTGCTALGCSRTSDSLVAQLLIAMVIFTTIQAQDFKDVEGDILVNRQTLPILLPTASRLVTSLLVPFWSLFFVYCYLAADPMVSSAGVVLGAIIGTRFWFERTRDGDKRSYLLYNVWLCFLHVIPFTVRAKAVFI